VIGRLLHPWRDARTWRSLVHTVLDLPLGIAAFVPTVVLLATGAALLVTLPLAVIPAVLLFVWARVVGKVERQRLAALHDVVLPDPVPPLPSGSVWARLKAALTSGPRWKEIAYGLALMPVGIVLSSLVIGAWAGAIALALLPAYVGALPGDTAQLWLLGASQGATAWAVALVGWVGVVLVAPWLTVGAGAVDMAFTRWLLGPRRDAELAARVARAETSRAAALDAAEAERRRIERDLHDGAQQRLVALAMDLGAARQRLDDDPEGGKALVAEAHEEAKAALKELRNLVRGIHPVILEDRGLDAALSAVVARSPVPVDLHVDVAERPPSAVESAAYFVVSEALANVARHAHATRASVSVVRAGDRLVVEVRDDGIGGADPQGGTGLAGLADRVASLDGTIAVLSPEGGPTTVLVELPCAS